MTSEAKGDKPEYDLDHPFPPEEWWWWYTRTDGESYDGRSATRDDVIAQAVDDLLCQEEFELVDGVRRIWIEIAECKETHNDLARHFEIDRWFDDLMDNDFAEQCAEFGDCGPLEQFSVKQKSDLEVRIKQAIRKWQVDHDLKLRGWVFFDARNHEKLVIDVDAELDIIIQIVPDKGAVQ